MSESKDILDSMFQEGAAGTVDLSGIVVDPNNYTLGFEVEMICQVEPEDRETVYEHLRLRSSSFEDIQNWFSSPDQSDLERVWFENHPAEEDDEGNEIEGDVGSLEELFSEFGPENYVQQLGLEPHNGWTDDDYGGPYYNGDESYSYDELDPEDYQNELESEAHRFFPCEAHTDSSLTPDDESSEVGMEFASDAFDGLDDGLEKIESAFTFIKRKGYTNKSCGFHVTLGWTGEGTVDPSKLRHIIGDTAMGRDFNDRHKGSYSRALPQHFDYRTRAIPVSSGSPSLTPKEKVERTKDRSKESYKYMAVNQRETNVFEFRMFGGKDYEQDFAKVQKWVNRAAQAIAAAADPKVKKKEYNKQLGYWADKVYGKPDPLAPDQKTLPSREYKQKHPNAVKGEGSRWDKDGNPTTAPFTGQPIAPEGRRIDPATDRVGRPLADTAVNNTTRLTDEFRWDGSRWVPRNPATEAQAEFVFQSLIAEDGQL